MAALDLGGGSTQVTFYAVTPASLKQKENIHQAASPNGPISVYTHSFLGLGLMAARKEIITVGSTGPTNVTSECVNTVVKGKKFIYGGVEYYVSGPQSNYPTSKQLGDSFSEGIETPIVNFRKCSDIISKYVRSKAEPPPELVSKSIFAFSYYFDRATEVGLIGTITQVTSVLFAKFVGFSDETTGGKVQVDDFKKVAEKACHEANVDQPFMCLDLTFIWTLLEKGLGLRGDTTIYVK